jgi:amidase
VPRARLGHDGGVTVVDAISHALGRLDAAAHLEAVVARDDEAALAAAAAIDRAGARGPLTGLGVTVKDWIEVAGLPCEGEAVERTGHVPARNATVVHRLREAGAVVLAKTQPGAHHSVHGTCHHPLDATRTPGGSSSGEAALIGARASVLGLGSDSGGSIRLPAAWCGACGLKPTFGLVPVTGHLPRVGGRHDGRTVIGPLAAGVDLLVVALKVIAGPDGRDPDAVPVAPGNPADVRVEGLRAAVIRGEGEWTPAPSTADAVERAARTLASAGATVLDEALPEHLDESLDLTRRYWDRAELPGAEADRQLWEWDRFRVRLLRAVSDVDVVLGPVGRDVAPLRRELTGADYVFTLPRSLTGWPAVSLPYGTDRATGLPLAVQVAAKPWQDHVALAVAAALEGTG